MRNEIETLNAVPQGGLSYEAMCRLALVDISLAVASTSAGVVAELVTPDLAAFNPQPQLLSVAPE